MKASGLIIYGLHLLSFKNIEIFYEVSRNFEKIIDKIEDLFN